MTAREEMCILLESWGMDPNRIPEDGLYSDGYDVIALNEHGKRIVDDYGIKLEPERRSYPDGFPYAFAMQIYMRILKERHKR